MRQERLPSSGQVDATRGPGEERRSDLGFQLANLLTQGRLRDPQLSGGPGEVPLIDDGQEVAEMPKLHVFLVRLEQTRVIASVLRMTPAAYAGGTDRVTMPP